MIRSAFELAQTSQPNQTRSLFFRSSVSYAKRSTPIAWDSVNYVFPTWHLALTLFVVLLGGCATPGDKKNADPIRQLDWATDLFTNQSRPLPAEELIAQVIESCSAKNDPICLGKAYLAYGLFFRSPAVKQYEAVYRKNGFFDKTATFDNRLVKSKDYIEKAVQNYLPTNQYGALANAYLNLGFAYYFLKDPKAECQPYAKSIEFDQKNLEQNPGRTTLLPPGYASFTEYVGAQQKRAGCI